MNRALFAAAFAAAIATAPFAFAQTSPNSEPKAPPPFRSMQNAPMPYPAGHKDWMRGGGMGPSAAEGPMWHHWDHGNWGRHRMAWGNPKEACIDRIAHRAAMLAYIGTKLDLTAQQQPLWQKLAATGRAQVHKQVDLCNKLGSEGPANLLDHLTLQRQILAARLAGLNAALPEVKALYEALTPEQREILDEPWSR